MKIIASILLTITMLLLLSSAAFANPMAGPADLLTSTSLLIFSLLLETAVVIFILRRFNLRLARFGPAWFLVNLVSFLTYVYSVYFVKPYIQPYVGPLFPLFAGEVVVIFGEGTILYFLTRLSWSRKPESKKVPLLRAYCASFIGNVVSISGPFLPFAPSIIFTYILFWPTLIPVFLLVLLFISFIVLKKKGYLQKRLPQITFLIIILLVSGVMIVLSLTGHYSLPTREMRGMVKSMSFLTFNPSPADLKDRDKSVRLQASIYLGMRPNPRNVQPLIDLLGDSDPEVRGLAAQSLGLIRDNRSVEPLIKALKDSDPFAREWAVRALGQIRDRRAVEPLQDIVKNESGQFKQVAEIALSEIERPQTERKSQQDKNEQP